MLAARWWAKGDIRVENIPDPGEPPAGWVRVRVDACGICGTDVEEYTHGPIVVPIKPHPLSGRCAPLTLGHETVGVVDVAGDGVSLKPGQRVAVESNIFCGSCWWCSHQHYQLCDSLASLGLMTDGGLAEYVLAPEYMCFPYSAKIGPAAAVFSEPLSVAVRAMRRGGINLGTTVGVIGAGTIGLLAIQVARVAGAQTVIAIDPLESRRKLALELGADAAVSPRDANEVTRQLTNGIGPDVMIEAAGSSTAGAAAVELTRRGGRAVLLGVHSNKLEIPMMDFLLGEKEVVASLSHTYDSDFATAVSLIDRGLIRTEPLLTDRIDLQDIVSCGLEALIAEPSAHLKIIVTPNGPIDDESVTNHRDAMPHRSLFKEDAR